jgi:hypothetical protein
MQRRFHDEPTVGAGIAEGLQVLSPEDIADELVAAERERKSIPQFSDADPDFDLETAYRAQQAFVQAKLDAGEQLVGYKLGLTSRNKQVAMGVDAPLYGRVTSRAYPPGTITLLSGRVQEHGWTCGQTRLFRRGRGLHSCNR